MGRFGVSRLHGNNAGLWTQGTGGAYMYPSTANQILGNDSAAGDNKLTGIYLTDTAPIYFGYDNDAWIRYSSSDNALNIYQGDQNG